MTENDAPFPSATAAHSCLPQRRSIRIGTPVRRLSMKACSEHHVDLEGFVAKLGQNPTENLPNKFRPNCFQVPVEGLGALIPKTNCTRVVPPARNSEARYSSARPLCLDSKNKLELNVINSSSWTIRSPEC